MEDYRHFYNPYNNTMTLRDKINYQFEHNPDDQFMCYQLQVIGILCIFLFIACIVFNSFLLWVFFKNKELQSSFNMFIVGLSTLNLIGSILEFPFIIISNLSCRWIFDEVGCIFSGYVMYFTGITSIYILVGLSLERYYIINSNVKNRFVSAKTVLRVMTACAFNGFIWASFPLFGWSHYTLEGANTSCAVEWHERSLNVVSYNMAMFIFVYFIPLLVISISNFRLIIMVIQLQRLLRDTSMFSYFKKKSLYEMKATIVMIIIVVGYFFSWTPYAIVTLYTAFINSHSVSPIMATIPAIFAKTSMLWTSVLYVFSNNQIKKKFNVDLISFIVNSRDNGYAGKSGDKTIYRKRKQNNSNPKQFPMNIIPNPVT